MTKLNPWTFGAVLSITVAVSYILCALFWYSVTGPSIEFLNAVFHGMDFRKIYAATPFSVGMFVYVLIVFAVWSYILGAIYAVVRNLLLAESKA
jgi:hypothetical protein